MTGVVLLLVIATALALPVRALLVRAHWTEHAPRAAILLWQAVGLGVGVALLGACLKIVSLSPTGPGPRRVMTDFTAALGANKPNGPMSPDDLFGLTVGLIVTTLLVGGLVARTVGVLRARAHQRLLIDLVSTERPGVPGALVLPHPTAMAFSLPGLRSRVVVSSGAIDALTEEELAAVLAHERAHARARHDLVLIPIHAMCSALPRSSALAAVREKIAALVEMAADDRALRECDPNALARALCAIATANVNPAGLAPASNATVRRVERALGQHPKARLAACGSALSAGVVLALPLVAILAPLGGH